MARNNELKETNIKNRTCYYFDNIINIDNLDLDNILLGDESYEHILIYHAKYKTPYGEQSVHIIFDNLNRYIKKYDSYKISNISSF